jgi:hypothetical protein
MLSAKPRVRPLTVRSDSSSAPLPRSTGRKIRVRSSGNLLAQISFPNPVITKSSYCRESEMILHFAKCSPCKEFARNIKPQHIIQKVLISENINPFQEIIYWLINQYQFPCSNIKSFTNEFNCINCYWLNNRDSFVTDWFINPLLLRLDHKEYNIQHHSRGPWFDPHYS